MLSYAQFFSYQKSFRMFDLVMFFAINVTKNVNSVLDNIFFNCSLKNRKCSIRDTEMCSLIRSVFLTSVLLSDVN